MGYPRPQRYPAAPKLCDRHGCKVSRYPAMRYCKEHAAEMRSYGFDPSVYAVNGVPRERAASMSAHTRGSMAPPSAPAIGKWHGATRRRSSAPRATVGAEAAQAEAAARTAHRAACRARDAAVGRAMRRAAKGALTRIGRTIASVPCAPEASASPGRGKRSASAVAATTSASCTAVRVLTLHRAAPTKSVYLEKHTPSAPLARGGHLGEGHVPRSKLRLDTLIRPHSLRRQSGTLRRAFTVLGKQHQDKRCRAW